MVEFYLGWVYTPDKIEGYNPGFLIHPRLFDTYVVIYSDYYFEQDAALMLLSEGGFNYQATRNTGEWTKDMYLRRFVQLKKSMNGSNNSGSVNTESGETP